MSSPPRDHQHQSDNKPETLQAAGPDATNHDCMGCRLVGTVVFISLAGYVYIHGMTEIERKKNATERANARLGIGARRLGIQTMAIGMLGLAWYRWRI